MGGKETKEAPIEPPKKSIKELSKEFTKTIRKMQREFNREKNKLEMNNKKIENDLQKMIKKKEPKSTMRIIAQNILRNNNYITKYNRLDAQMNDIIFQLNSASTTETLVEVMKGMSGVMKQTNQNLDVYNVQKVMETYNMEMEKNNIMQEQMNDIMMGDEDEITDDDADKIITEMEIKVGGNGGGGMIVQNNANPQLESKKSDLGDRINAL